MGKGASMIDLSRPGTPLMNPKIIAQNFPNEQQGNLGYNSTGAHPSFVEFCPLRVLSSSYFHAAL